MLQPVAVTKTDASAGLFRLLAGLLAAVVCASGTWLIVTELISPPAMRFPTDAKTAQEWSAHRAISSFAASVGFLRSDLWADAAISKAAPVFFQTGSAGLSPGDLQDALDTAGHAAKLAPHDARIWLSVAALESARDPNGNKAADALKLSYYAGPYQPSLVPLRLSLALRSRAIVDPELQELVSLEIQRVVLKQPDLKPAILAAYRTAIPPGRALIETTLQQVDPALLKAARSQ